MTEFERGVDEGLLRALGIVTSTPDQTATGCARAIRDEMERRALAPETTAVTAQLTEQTGGNLGPRPAAAPGAEIETARTDAMEHDGLRTLALQEANGESSRSSCSVAPITDAHLRHLAVQQIVDLERDLTRLRTACLALADEMERTGRQGDADRLREIAR